jgi:NAD(P)-dependent dehydrogenase (short-subunit alcohol dehydrogenase family)
VQPASLIGAVNFFGARATVEGLRDLVAKKRGSILIVSSNSAPMVDAETPFVQACLAGDEAAALELATDGNTAYMGSKRAITQWMRRNVKDYAADGIRINAIAPGITQTAMTEAVSRDPAFSEAIRQFEAMTPLGGAARPGQIASVMKFLLSEQASFICGAMLFVDGGTDALLRPDNF